jgi:hypothetical protein
VSTPEENNKDRGCLTMGCEGEYYHLRGQNRILEINAQHGAL